MKDFKFWLAVALVLLFWTIFSLFAFGVIQEKFWDQPKQKLQTIIFTNGILFIETNQPPHLALKTNRANGTLSIERADGEPSRGTGFDVLRTNADGTFSIMHPDGSLVPAILDDRPWEAITNLSALLTLEKMDWHPETKARIRRAISNALAVEPVFPNITNTVHFRHGQGNMPPMGINSVWNNTNVTYTAKYVTMVPETNSDTLLPIPPGSMISTSFTNLQMDQGATNFPHFTRK